MYKMYIIPVNENRYWLFNKENNICYYIGTIADVKNYIDTHGTSDLSMDFTIKKKIRTAELLLSCSNGQFITETKLCEYVPRPNVIIDDKYRIFNYQLLDMVDIPTTKPLSVNYFRNRGSKPHYRSKQHYRSIVSLREKRFAKMCESTADDICAELDDIAYNTIDHALCHTRINNRMKNISSNHREFYGTPVSWKQSHKKKQWQKNHDTKYLDKHALIYETHIFA